MEEEKEKEAEEATKVGDQALHQSLEPHLKDEQVNDCPKPKPPQSSNQSLTSSPTYLQHKELLA